MALQVRGMNQLLKKFDKFAEEIKVEAQQELLANCLVEIETVAKEKLTQDAHIDTGRLRASIYTKHIDKKTNRYSDNEGNSYICDLKKSVKELQFIVGTNVEYAWKIERLDPYMLYAYKQAKPVIIKNMDKFLNKITAKYNT